MQQPPVSVFGTGARPVTSMTMTATKTKPLRASVLGTPLLGTKNNLKVIQTRPQTRSSLGVKSWRANLFPSSSPASKREVELLGEWLNSVLAENLETNENPLDVCTNAQHWFSVAFNELLRQVSVTCAERGRLFAVIWKRNQDLLSKLVQIQKQERQYILQCHKERVQFLKTDLDFSKSRLETVQNAYNEEMNRWNESHEKDLSKFDNLQQKIDEQVVSRNALLSELRDLQQKLGIKPQMDNDLPSEPAPTFQAEDMRGKMQEVRKRIRAKKTTNNELMNLMDELDAYLKQGTLSAAVSGIRSAFSELFLSLPANAQPRNHEHVWLNAAISFIYSYYLAAIESNGISEMSKVSFPHFIYETFLNLYGTREETEQTILDLFTHAYNVRQESSRAEFFVRFIGLVDPLDNEVLHFYLYCLSLMNKEHNGPLFPENEGADQIFISPFPAASLINASDVVLQRFTEGRTLKFYTERIAKITQDGSIRFGRQNVAELDAVLSYLTNAYIDENGKYDEICSEFFQNGSIQTFTQFRNALQASRQEIPVQEHTRLMAEILKRGEINKQSFSEFVRPLGYFKQFVIKTEEFKNSQSTEDIVPFVKMELDAWDSKFQEVLKKLEAMTDEVAAKQLRASKAKLEQVLSGRSIGRTSNQLMREFFERTTLAQANI